MQVNITHNSLASALFEKKNLLESCQPNYFGRRCEVFGIQLENGAVLKYNRSCNLTINVFNQGGYTAYFVVDYQDYKNAGFTLKSNFILLLQVEFV